MPIAAELEPCSGSVKLSGEFEPLGRRCELVLVVQCANIFFCREKIRSRNVADSSLIEIGAYANR